MKRILIAWDFFGVINAVEPLSLQKTLQRLMDVGAENIIVSHSTKSEIEQYLELNQLSQYFSSIYGAEWHQADAGMGKAPALLNYIDATENFDEMYMVGDSLNDMADARQAKLRTILFDADHHYSNVTNEADLVVDSLQAVVELIGKADD